MRAVCAPKCLEKDAHADFLCLHCYPNAVGDNTWAYFEKQFLTVVFLKSSPWPIVPLASPMRIWQGAHSVVLIADIFMCVG